MLYNGATMTVMLAPPLAKKDIVDRIYTFEPATFGDADLISISRLRRLMVSNIVYRWDRDKLRLLPLSLTDTVTSKRLPFKGSNGLVLSPSDIVLSPPIDLPASQIDAIVVKLTPASCQKLQTLKDSTEAKDAVLCLSYKGGLMAIPMVENAGSGQIVFQLSEHKNWLKQGLVHELSLKTLGCPETIAISSIEALNVENQMPIVEADGRGLVEGPDGICRVHGARPSFSYNVSNVPGAAAAICEVSKPNSWFEHYSNTLRDKQVSKNALFVINWDKLKGRDILLSFAGIKDHGFYQIKVAAVDKDGKVLGYFSDPLNFQI
jgi:hypothetical protein